MTWIAVIVSHYDLSATLKDLQNGNCDIVDSVTPLKAGGFIIVYRTNNP